MEQFSPENTLSPEVAAKQTAKLNRILEKALSYDLVENIIHYEDATDERLDKIKELDTPEAVIELRKYRDSLKTPTLQSELQEAKINVLNKIIIGFQNREDENTEYDAEKGLPPREK